MEVLSKITKYKVRCPKCDSELKFELGEVTFGTVGDGHYGHVICPVCGNYVFTHKYDDDIESYKLLNYVMR